MGIPTRGERAFGGAGARLRPDYLSERVGQIPPGLMVRVEAGLRRVLAL